MIRQVRFRRLREWSYAGPANVAQLCGDCVTDPDDSDCPEVPYIKAMSVLRQATKGTPDALMDKLLLEFLTEADLELQNTSTNRSRQKLYISAITALIDYLNIRNMPHAVLSDFHTELNNRAVGFKGQFSFDAEAGRKSQTLEDATRQALVLAYYEAFPKDRSTTYKLAKKHLSLNRGQVVQRAADARKGTNKRSEIDNLRRWAEQRVRDPNFDKSLYFPDD